MTTAISQPKPALGTVWRNGLIAAVVATLINAILFLVGAAMGGFPAMSLRRWVCRLRLQPCCSCRLSPF